MVSRSIIPVKLEGAFLECGHRCQWLLWSVSCTSYTDGVCPFWRPERVCKALNVSRPTISMCCLRPLPDRSITTHRLCLKCIQVNDFIWFIKVYLEYNEIKVYFTVTQDLSFVCASVYLEIWLLQIFCFSWPNTRVRFWWKHKTNGFMWCSCLWKLCWDSIVLNSIT